MVSSPIKKRAVQVRVPINANSKGTVVEKARPAKESDAKKSTAEKKSEGKTAPATKGASAGGIPFADFYEEDTGGCIDSP